MSTYYGFQCNRCQVSGGHMSRQMWGVGNADLIDTFKFVMYHALECGTANVQMVSEHEDRWKTTNIPGPLRRKHLEDTKGIFPRSDDWGFMESRANMPTSEVDKAWIESELAWEKEQESDG